MQRDLTGTTNEERRFKFILKNGQEFGNLEQVASTKGTFRIATEMAPEERPSSHFFMGFLDINWFS
jgi:hypothetical protein